MDRVEHLGTSPYFRMDVENSLNKYVKRPAYRVEPEICRVGQTRPGDGTARQSRLLAKECVMHKATFSKTTTDEQPVFINL